MTISAAHSRLRSNVSLAISDWECSRRQQSASGVSRESRLQGKESSWPHQRRTTWGHRYWGVRRLPLPLWAELIQQLQPASRPELLRVQVATTVQQKRALVRVPPSTRRRLPERPVQADPEPRLHLKQKTSRQRPEVARLPRKKKPKKRLPVPLLQLKQRIRRQRTEVARLPRKKKLKKRLAVPLLRMKQRISRQMLEVA